MPPASIAALSTLTDEQCAALRARLREVGFTPKILAYAESVAAGIFDPMRLPLVRDALLERGDHAGALAALLVYGGTVPRGAVVAALGAGLASALCEAGVLRSLAAAADGAVAVDDALGANFRLTPAYDLWILADEFAIEEETAMAPGGTTLNVLAWLPARIEGRALDVGCGAGTLALVLAARGARDVVGTDISPRAVEVARFNARLNGLRVDFRVGGLYAPVAGERFDLVVAQPPYVFRAPETGAIAYLHGGAVGDELATEFVAGAPAVLGPGGRALFLYDSAVRAGAPLVDRLRTALGDARVDLVVLTSRGSAPDVQAVAYAALETSEIGERYARAAVRYRRHLKALGVEEFSSAAVVLRARPEGPGAEPYSVSLPVRSVGAGSGAALEGIIRALDTACLGDRELLAAKVAPVAGVRWVEERAGLGTEAPVTHRMVFPKGAIATDREVSEASVALCAMLQEAAAVAGAVDLYAEACGATPDEVRAQVLEFVRDSLARGVLVPRA
jgi:methylase of polypeptide subunit release factors